jgi:HlyD family secretion protein
MKFFKKRSNLVITGIILAVIISASWFFTRTLAADETAAPVLQTAKVRTGDIVLIASGAGTVVPAKEVDLGFKTGGLIAEINVKVGDKVEEGDVLARQVETDIRSQILQAERNLEYLTSPYAIASVEQALIKAQEALQVANYNNLVQQEGYRASDSTIDVLNADLILAQEKVDRLQGNFDVVAYLPEDDLRRATALAALSSAITARDKILASMNWYLGTPSETEQFALDNEVAVAAAKVSAAESYLAAIQGEPLPENIFIGPELKQLWDVESALFDVRMKLSDINIIAPFSGTVTSLNAIVGQTVGTSSIMSIATTQDLQVRFYLDETDANKVAVGNRVDFSFDAYPDLPMEGKIISVEPAMQMIDGTPVIVTWATLLLETDRIILSGMTVEADVIAGESLQTLIVPIQALRELSLDSYAVFIVQADGQLVMTPVTVGLRDYANAEILSGVKAGDVVSTGTIETK